MDFIFLLKYVITNRFNSFSMNNSIKILVIDDQEIVYSGIKITIQPIKGDWELIHCCNEDDCYKLLKKQQFDLIIMEINIPEIDPYQLINFILTLKPGQKILIFSNVSEEMYAKRLLKLGALGFVSKLSSNEEFLNAIFSVINGRLYISSFLSRKFAQDIINDNIAKNGFDKLTGREFEIMNYFLNGNNGKEISNNIHLHSSTIGTYKSRIFKKLGVKNLLELNTIAQLHGIKQ